MTDTPRIGVLVSGRGSNLAALIRAIDVGELAAQITLVISSKSDVAALALAKAAGIPTAVMRPRDFASRAEEGAAIVAALQAAEVVLH
jgi:phosphoribosylglycinamide formyltransferase 1